MTNYNSKRYGRLRHLPEPFRTQAIDEYNRQKYLKDKEGYIRRAKKWAETNKERLNQLKKEWARKNKEKVKATAAESRWKWQGINLTSEEYGQMTLTQDAKCYICGKIPKRRRLAVDHNHQTGKVRKLLCTHCNVKVGWVENLQADPAFYQKVLDYLKKHQDSPVSHTSA